MSGTNDLITNEIETKNDRSNGLLIESIESIEMKPLNNNNPVIPSNPLLLHMPPDCCPRMISKYFECCKYFIPQIIQQQWTSLRSKAHRLVEHRFFEWLIIASILASSTTLVSRKESSIEGYLLLLKGIGRYKYTTKTGLFYLLTFT